MKIEIKDSDIILHGVKCFDLDLTLDCGQAFRWVKEKDGSYSGVVKGVYLNIKKLGDDTFILKDTAKQDFDNIWRNYFDFDKDYVKICNTLKEDELLSSTIDEYYGIRILNQDSWEALCSFVISQQNNIKRIKGIIERLCRKYGKEVLFSDCRRFEQAYGWGFWSTRHRLQGKIPWTPCKKRFKRRNWPWKNKNPFAWRSKKRAFKHLRSGN